jgi:hypothetical protein
MTSGVLLLSGGDVVIPAALLAALLHELEQPKQRLPLDVAAPRRTPQIVELVALIWEGAVAHRQRLRESSRKRESLSQLPSVPPLAASAPAGSLSMDGKVVSVAVAAEMLGKSHQWVRRLATTGALPGAHKGRGFGNGRGTARICWRIPLTAVHAYRADRGVV